MSRSERKSVCQNRTSSNSQSDDDPVSDAQGSQLVSVWLSSEASRPFTALTEVIGKQVVALRRVSKIPPERYPEASGVKEGAVDGEQMSMPSQQPKLAKPSVGSLHNPAALVTAQFAFILIPPLRVVGPVSRNQLRPKTVMQACRTTESTP